MLPDWRNPAQYPDPDSASLHQWAWEFLRRNPAFVAEAEPAGEENLAMKAAGQLPATWHKTPLGAVMAKWGIRDPNVSEWMWRVRRHKAPVFDAAPWPPTRNPARGANTYAITFDLGAPIDRQVERARSMLATQQRFHNPDFRRKRTRVAKFPLYLRILDALEA